MMNDRIEIEGLELETTIGVTEAEREHTMTLVADVMIYRDLHAAAASDNLAKTVDYGAVARELRSLSAKETNLLLEALGEKLIAHLYATFNADRAITRIDLRLRKMNFVSHTASVGIFLSR